MAGSHGKTAGFWINYTYLMDMYLMLHCAMKMNDIQLFACALSDQFNFFSINHHNYANLMTLYSLELMSLPRENPSL